MIVCPRWREVEALVELLVQFGDAVSPVEPPEYRWAALRFVLQPVPAYIAPALPSELANAAHGLCLDERVLLDWEQHALADAARSALETALEAFARLPPCAVVYENATSDGSQSVPAKAGSLFARLDERIGRVGFVVASVPPSGA